MTQDDVFSAAAKFLVALQPLYVQMSAAAIALLIIQLVSRILRAYVREDERKKKKEDYYDHYDQAGIPALPHEREALKQAMYRGEVEWDNDLMRHDENDLALWRAELEKISHEKHKHTTDDAEI